MRSEIFLMKAPVYIAFPFQITALLRPTRRVATSYSPFCSRLCRRIPVA
jgi:hypothetical protein